MTGAGVNINPDSPVTAYCAPGQRAYAILLLEHSGDEVREIIEHPWMAGRTDVFLATDPGWPVTGSPGDGSGQP